MRLLFFFVSLFFSFLFYSFFQLTKGKNMYGDLFTSAKDFSSLSGNLLYETAIFIVFAFIGLFLFRSFSWKKNNDAQEDFMKNYYLIFWAFFACIFVFPFLYKDNFIFGAIIFFIFGELCFSILSEMDFFREQKLSIKYFGLGLNYIAVFVSLYYLGNIEGSFILLSILIYSGFFNFWLHKKYTNYISLGFSGVILVFLLFFMLSLLYSKVISILS